MEFKNKLEIFISSKIGDDLVSQKYNLARKAIKELLESTGFFNIYLFEEAGTASASAKVQYINKLKRTDICIFLIDNLDGVPQGVQIEVDEALKQNIPSLFYFCTENSKEKTALQKRLSFPDAPKTMNISSFENFIERGKNDLINEVFSVYQQYSTRGNIAPSNNILTEKFENTNIESEITPIVSSSKKQQNGIVIDRNLNKDYCKLFFRELFSISNSKINSVDLKDSNIDYYCYSFLSVLIKGKDFETFSKDDFIKKLKNLLPKEYYCVIKLRWESIELYWENDLDGSIEVLKRAYIKAIKSDLDSWFINDILIDLRNQIQLNHEEKNEYTTNNFAQNELSNRNESVFYPNIDRFEKNLLNLIEKDNQNTTLNSFTTTAFIADRSMYTDLIASIFFEAMIFGSSTHILRINSLIEKLSYHLFKMNSQWEMFKLYLSSLLYSGNIKTVKKVKSKFSIEIEKVSFEDSKQIYEYISSNVIENAKFSAQLLTIGTLGYYFDDQYFDFIWTDLKHKLDSWCKDPNSSVFLEANIFYALDNLKERISPDYIINFCLNILRSRKKRFFDSALKLLSDSITSVSISYKKVIEVNKYILNSLDDQINSLNEEYFNSLCCNTAKVLKKIDRKELDDKILSKRPNFYKLQYKIETEIEEADLTYLFNKEIKNIHERNKIQGKNGIYSFQSESSFLMLRNILLKLDKQIEASVYDDILLAVSTTILDSKQSVGDKIEAYQLLYLIIKKDKDIIYRKRNEFQKLTKLDKETESFESMLSYVQKETLNLAHLLLLSLLEIDIKTELIKELSTYTDEGTQVVACKIIQSYLLGHSNLNYQSNLLSIFFQFSLIWINSQSSSVRWHTTFIMKELVYFKEFTDEIMSQFMRIISEDNAYIKSIILHDLKKLKNLDKNAVEFILNKCLVDSNYVIRKKAYQQK